ncbi:MAG: hypothetical protein K2X39_08430, partial [Silvanigrellaceae bacterium]|nr:hypothetical protein [Silvanigrellaceae bacterium]
QTRIKFITEGLFLKFLMRNPALEHCECVILDEFHERHIYSDITLMLVKHLQSTLRPDLKILVMSATLDVGNLARYFNNVSFIDLKTKVHPIDINYLPYETNIPLEELVLNSVDKVLTNKINKQGDILVFLPGSKEIRKTQQLLLSIKEKHHFEILLLKADLSPLEQQKAFSPCEKTKVILSTNIAETSLTIEGVNCVIDSGLARIAAHGAWSGLPTLDVKPVSQASCIQRSGRAGRGGPGYALRLYTQYDYSLRPAFEKPEIQRLDLAQIFLDLKVLEKRLFEQGMIEQPNTWDWFEPPCVNNLKASLQLLIYLEAIDANHQVTELGEQMAHYPFHPRLARILVEAKKKKIFYQSLALVALISEGMIFKFVGEENPIYAHSDIEEQLGAFKKLLLKENLEEKYKRLIDFTKYQRVEKILKHLSTAYQCSFSQCFMPISSYEISQLLLCGFPDRICQIRARKQGNNSKKEANLCQGGGATLSHISVVQDSEYFIAIDAEENTQGVSRCSSTSIRVAHGLEKDFLLLEGHPGFISEKREETYWDELSQSVLSYSRTYYGKLVLEEKKLLSVSQQTEKLLFKRLCLDWPKPFYDLKALEFFKVRCEIVNQFGYPIDVLNFDNIDDLHLLFQNMCEGKKSYQDILSKNLHEYIDDFFSVGEKQILNQICPRTITIGRDFKVTVHYELGKPPWIAAKLQNFFGCLETPKIAGGQLSTIVHLLAPNGQSVQVTSDLKGFWQRIYPSVRKELMRKYPKHFWPEDPSQAEPPELRRGRKI